MKLYSKVLWHDWQDGCYGLTFKRHNYSHKDYNDALNWDVSVEYDAYQFDSISELRDFILSHSLNRVIVRAVENKKDGAFNPLNNWESSINYLSTHLTGSNIEVRGRYEVTLPKRIRVESITDRVTERNLKKFLFLVNPEIKSEDLSDKIKLEANGQTDIFGADL